MIVDTCFKSVFAAAMLFGTSISAFAQDTAPLPGQSTESFQDWSVECTSVKKPVLAEGAAVKGDKPEQTAENSNRICEAVQVYRNNKTGNEIARLAFAYGIKGSEKAGILLAGLRVIVDVSFKGKPSVTSGGTALFEGEFERCIGNYCYASLALPEQGAKPLEEATDPALQFPISNGRMISIKVSSKGLTDALKVIESRK